MTPPPAPGALRLLSVLLVLSSCSSPTFDPKAGEELKKLSREEQVARYFAARGLTLAAAAESPWTALPDLPALVLTLHNGGLKSVILRGRRYSGLWPFGTEEHARAILQVDVTYASVRSGLQQFHDDLPVDEIETLEIPPGAERSLRLPVDAHLAPDVECVHIEVHPILIPLAIEVEGEPERVLVMHFPPVRLNSVPLDVAAAPPDDPAPLEAALASHPEQVVAAAVRAAEKDRIGTIERLMLALPGPDPAARRARLTALEWLTGRRLGDSVERWRSWWESDQGASLAPPLTDRKEPR